jgi:hypothetical protein
MGLALVFAMAASACGHRFQTGLLTAAATAVVSTPAATPTPTPAATPSPGTVLAADDFSAPSVGLMPRSCAGDADVAGVPFQCGYVGGEYQLDVVQPTNEGLGVAEVPGAYSFAYGAANSTVDVDVRLATAGPGAVGVRCRRLVQGPSAFQSYALLIRPGSETFTLERLDPASGNTNTVVLVGPQPSSAIHQGTASNHLQLTCNGNTISASINGTRVASIQDGTYQFGRVALVAETSVSGPPNTVDMRFSHLVLTQP